MIEIREEPLTSLREYGTVPIAFEVRSVLALESAGLGGLTLVERAVETPRVKDYDAIRGEGPERWTRRWDLSNWGLLAAHDGSRRVGGAAIAWRTEGVEMLRRRDDLAVLWDLRVVPDRRRCGVGERLFAAAVAWAEARGARDLEVETQNINVPACRFYARQGCTLGAVSRLAYRDLPDEIELIWHLRLNPSGT